MNNEKQRKDEIREALSLIQRVFINTDNELEIEQLETGLRAMVLMCSERQKQKVKNEQKLLDITDVKDAKKYLNMVTGTLGCEHVSEIFSREELIDSINDLTWNGMIDNFRGTGMSEEEAANKTKLFYMRLSKKEIFEDIIMPDTRKTMIIEKARNIYEAGENVVNWQDKD